MRNFKIIFIACVITFIAVGVEFYIWKKGAVLPSLPTVGSIIPNNNVGKSNTLQTSFDQIKTKEQGIAACEANKAYSKTAVTQEQKQMGAAMTDYCYSVIAGTFSDLGLCSRTSNASECQKTAQEFLEMKKEIEKMTPEEREQMQKVINGKFNLPQ